MGALEDFLETLPDTFDVSQLLDPDVDKIESDVHTAPIIYKYLASSRRPQFFKRPQFRFSQREALNDPLEMSTRWNAISTAGLRQYLDHRLHESLPKTFLNSELQVQIFAEEAKKQGMLLSAEQSALVAELLRSDAGKAFQEQQLAQIMALVPLIIDRVFSEIETNFQTLTDNVIGKLGVLSLTEDPLNAQMWAHYASGGAGFVVGLDAHHSFFRKDGRSSLRRVLYTNKNTENFWRNPYFLFLVKTEGWSYEREWRVLKQLENCDEQVGPTSSPIFLSNIPVISIRSIHFGYKYDRSQMTDDVASIRNIGASPELFFVQPNRQKGTLESISLNL